MHERIRNRHPLHVKHSSPFQAYHRNSPGCGRSYNIATKLRLGRMGSFLGLPARQLSNSSEHSVTHQRGSTVELCGSQNKIYFAMVRRQATLLSLPEELFDDISCWLDVKDFCSMERSNSRLRTIVSTPCRAGPTENVLDLEALWAFEAGSEMRPRALGWFVKKMKRYKRICSDTSDPTMLEGSYNTHEEAPDASVPPVLPSLLESCAPSTALKLSVYPEQGDNFLAMSCAQGPGPELSFWPNLKRHLTVLDLKLSPGKGKVGLLGALSTLTALQTLTVEATPDPDLPHRYRDSSREESVWELPHLTSLQMVNLENGELTLLCPKLSMAWFVNSNFLHIILEEAVLKTLVLNKCKIVHFECNAEECLQNLESLRVTGCSEVGSLLIENLGIMSKLQKLTYDNFPTRCLMQNLMLCLMVPFPQSLADVSLCISDWPINLPRGLKELPKLRSLTFNSGHEDWSVTRPLSEILPLDSLRSMKIGVTEYSAKELSKLKALSLRKDRG